MLFVCVHTFLLVGWDTTCLVSKHGHPGLRGARYDLVCRVQVVKEADIIFLAVKPQFVAPVLKEVRQHLTEKHTIVSIAAGKTLASLKVPPSL